MATARWITKRKSQLQLGSSSVVEVETTNNPIPTPVVSTPSLTKEADSAVKKPKKNKKKAASNDEPSGACPETVKDAEPASTDSLGTEGSNPYCDVIQRRLRTLRKRMAKIEKYEVADPLTLNLDQVQAISKKEVVATTIKELEDMLSQLEVVEKEEYQQLESLEKEEFVFNQKVWLEKETKLTMNWEAKFSYYYRVLYILDALFINQSDNISSVALRFTDVQFNALLYLRSILAGVGLDASQCSLEVFSINAEKTLTELMAASESEFINGISYAAMGEMLERLFSPPAPPVFGTAMQEVSLSQNVGEASLTMPSEDSPIVDQVVETSGFVRPPLKALNSISFINPSEILEDVSFPEPETLAEVPLELTRDVDQGVPCDQDVQADSEKNEVKVQEVVELAPGDKPKRQRSGYRGGRGGFRPRGPRKKTSADDQNAKNDSTEKSQKPFYKKTSDGFKGQRPSPAAAHQGDTKRRPRPPKAAAAAQA